MYAAVRLAICFLFSALEPRMQAMVPPPRIAAGIYAFQQTLAMPFFVNDSSTMPCSSSLYFRKASSTSRRCFAFVVARPVSMAVATTPTDAATARMVPPCLRRNRAHVFVSFIVQPPNFKSRSLSLPESANSHHRLLPRGCSCHHLW